MKNIDLDECYSFKAVYVSFLVDAKDYKSAEQYIYELIKPNHKDALIGFHIYARDCDGKRGANK
jgi:hypothetical protein